MTRLLLVCCLLSALVGVGCAASAAQEPPGTHWPVLVKLAASAADMTPERIVRVATQAAGVRVSYSAAVAPRWHALTLGCSDDAACGDALQRLSMPGPYFEAVERDARRTRQH